MSILGGLQHAEHDRIRPRRLRDRRAADDHRVKERQPQVPRPVLPHAPEPDVPGGRGAQGHRRAAEPGARGRVHDLPQPAHRREDRDGGPGAVRFGDTNSFFPFDSLDKLSPSSSNLEFMDKDE